MGFASRFATGAVQIGDLRHTAGGWRDQARQQLAPGPAGGNAVSLSFIGWSGTPVKGEDILWHIRIVVINRVAVAAIPFLERAMPGA